jgi:hypothetical protein
MAGGSRRCAAPQQELALNLDKIALVVPDRRVVLMLKRAAKAARGENTNHMLKALERAARSVERHLPEDYFPELWKLVHLAPSTQDAGADRYFNHAYVTPRTQGE